MMNIDKMIELLKMDTISVPMYLLKYHQTLKLDGMMILLLAYLMNHHNLFDCKKMSQDLNIDEKDVLNYINQLQEHGLLNIRVAKNSKGIVEECLSLDPFYNKLALLLIDNNDLKKEDNNIYDLFEKELGRTLSPMEYEIISGWLDSKYSEELIKEALKEAVYNGANNLRYIDKILFEWHKKGFKKLDDVHKDREHFRKKKDTKIEVPDYNWLEENE